jgi:predicted DNA-binding transcriptional regulator AlpA
MAGDPDLFKEAGESWNAALNQGEPAMTASVHDPQDTPLAAAARAVLKAPVTTLNMADLPDWALVGIDYAIAVSGKRRTSIHDGVRAGTFPAPIRSGMRCTRWTVGSLKQWAKAQIEAQQDEINQRQQARAKKASNAAQAKRQIAEGAQK